MQRGITELLAVVPSTGRAGADFRTACQDLIVKAQIYIGSDTAGPPLASCFSLAASCGATQAQLASVRDLMLSESPVTVGAVMIQQSIIEMCLATEGRVIADMTFTSRQDVEALRDQMNSTFGPVEEIAADEMDQMTYRAVVELHAAIIQHLVVTARPLPRMVQFQFVRVMPTLTMANRLYADAKRADELRQENKVVHPAFMLPTGVALSA